jgi:hypothetical protein
MPQAEGRFLPLPRLIGVNLVFPKTTALMPWINSHSPALRPARTDHSRHPAAFFNPCGERDFHRSGWPKVISS